MFQSTQTYVIDAFTLYAASGWTMLADILSAKLTQVLFTALACVACFRSLAGFGFPLFAPAMYNALGYGKGNTILACVSIALGWPAYVSSSVPCIMQTTDIRVIGPAYSGFMENEYALAAAMRGNRISNRSRDRLCHTLHHISWKLRWLQKSHANLDRHYAWVPDRFEEGILHLTPTCVSFSREGARSFV